MSTVLPVSEAILKNFPTANLVLPLVVHYFVSPLSKPLLHMLSTKKYYFNINTMGMTADQVRVQRAQGDTS